jgi:NADH-quinone oxidoreductase subunit G
MSASVQDNTQVPMINFTINGQAVSVPKGWTVLKASRKLGIEIPHYCAHPGLSVAGACRLCMVEVKGRAKPEIACNLEATEGMEILTQTSLAKDAQQGALEFHLVNHPLDCPICDQAGECGLQNYYMTHGGYQSAMRRPKVLKPKALDVGKNLVLDTERCILCKRCERFESEITRTNSLQVQDRGDRAIISLTSGMRIDHNYATNLVDICPVGAFTSRDFRFKQRAWFLKEKEAICPGCSTNCRVKVFGRPQRGTFFRLLPREDQEVNGWWMCDTGRDYYEHLNVERRLRQPRLGNASVSLTDALKNLSEKLSSTPAEQSALILSAQYTCEEYAALLAWWKSQRPNAPVYTWRSRTENLDDFDGILRRGDHNANTKGLERELQKAGIHLAGSLSAAVAKRPALAVVLAPEIPSTITSYTEDLAELAALPSVAMMGVGGDWANIRVACALPLKGYAEKVGTFVNFKGIEGRLNDPFPCAIHDARTVSEIVELLKGR